MSEPMPLCVCGHHADDHKNGTGHCCFVWHSHLPDDEIILLGGAIVCDCPSFLGIEESEGDDSTDS